MRVARPISAPVWGLRNCRAPVCALEGAALAGDRDGFALVDILVAHGRIASLMPAGVAHIDADAPFLDLAGAILLPCFADIHVHLDKGQIWRRQPNPDGSFAGALQAVATDRAAHWSAADVMARIEFGLACAYAHGTTAMRTHIDSLGPQIAISWPVVAQLREKWADKVALQATPLFGVPFALDDAHMAELEAALERFGSNILGAVTYMVPELQPGLDRLFKLAMAKGYDLDFHVDETKDPAAHSLRLIAQTALRLGFKGRILAGHCCSLAMQPDDEARRTIDLVAQAGVSVVSLPMCNLYLQDRRAGGTPRWRGVTLLHELKAAGVEAMIASDNTRDPFYAYGDLDMLEVLGEGVRIAHLDHSRGDWLRAVCATPAAHMGMPGHGGIALGGPADFIVTCARSHTELLARPHSDRTVVRAGRAIDAAPPAYGALDHLHGLKP